jgi:hypothetical protein
MWIGFCRIFRSKGMVFCLLLELNGEHSWFTTTRDIIKDSGV